MNFAEAQQYLYSLGNEVSAMKLGLDAMRTLLRELGDPHKIYLKVQVAGTNGKGSVCAFLDSICNTAGIKTGTLTSPHLVSITERIRVNGRDISENGFGRLAGVVREASELLVENERLDAVPTFFEQVTAIGLLAFAEAGVEIAILETGLGGRLDATTAADAEIAVITRIDLDHQEYLGSTMEQIAGEKAAIIHPGSKVVVGPQGAKASRVIRERCLAVGVMPAYADPGSLHLRPGLPGRHQVENAAIAVEAARLISESLPVSDEAISSGLQHARHPGRLEYFGRYLLDGAHNVGGARALANYLKEFEPRPITMIFGAMKDKDDKEIASILFPLAKRIVLTTPDNSRAIKADELAGSFASATDVVLTANVRDAMAAAEALTSDDGLILVTGSLYLAGEVRSLISDMKFEI